MTTSKQNTEKIPLNKSKIFKNNFLKKYIEKIEQKYSNKEKILMIAGALILYLFFLFYSFFSPKENLKLGIFKGLSNKELEDKKKDSKKENLDSKESPFSKDETIKK